MNRPAGPSRNRLKAVARRAMRQRGLEPDFSSAAQAEAASAVNAAARPEPSARDLRGLLWASIDNDDSRDLDQLSVAEPLPAAPSRSSSPSPTSTPP